MQRCRQITYVNGKRRTEPVSQMADQFSHTYKRELPEIEFKIHIEIEMVFLKLTLDLVSRHAAG